jgi:hypothetical protein
MKKPKMDYRYKVNFLYKGVQNVFNLNSSRILDMDDVFYSTSHELKKTNDGFDESFLQIIDFDYVKR